MRSSLASRKKPISKERAAMLAGISAFSVTAVMLVICANLPIDVFPCDVTRRTSDGALETTASTCSLKAHLQPEVNGEKEELTDLGWVFLVVSCAGIGAIDAAVLYTVLSRAAERAGAHD